MSCGEHVLKSWSTTQATVALSSAEAELYSLVKGAALTLGMLALAQDLGESLSATVNTDASATLGIIQRQGLGKLRHVSTQFLWIQEKVRTDAFDIAKVPGYNNSEAHCKSRRADRRRTSQDGTTSQPHNRGSRRQP